MMRPPRGLPGAVAFSSEIRSRKVPRAVGPHFSPALLSALLLSRPKPRQTRPPEKVAATSRPPRSQQVWPRPLIYVCIRPSEGQRRGRRQRYPCDVASLHPAPQYAAAPRSPGDRPPKARPLPRTPWPEEAIPPLSEPIGSAGSPALEEKNSGGARTLLPLGVAAKADQAIGHRFPAHQQQQQQHIFP